jgi:catechol 2,3-dioxygenase-like lactoylglutathione lyase family enzyme
MVGGMAIKRMDHVGIVVEDLAAATAFFVALGMEKLGEAEVQGDVVDRIIAVDGAHTDLVMLGTPDGGSRLEVVAFRSPDAPDADHAAPSNAPGLRHLCFNVDDLEATLERLRPHGAQLVGEVVRYGDSYLLCYVRGPDGVIVELAEDIG